MGATRWVGCVPGAPCWVSLATEDLAVACDFYGPLLGWTFEAAPDRWGSTCRAMAGGLVVASLTASSRELEIPVAWTTYLGTGDADAAAGRVREHGGTVAVGPLAFDAGRVALAADPFGGTFGIWQGRPGPVRPLEMPGSPVWIELRTADAFAAALFYGRVFDWDELAADGLEVRWEHERVVLGVQGHTVAALRGGASPAAAAPQSRPRWHVYFSVDDADRALQQARTLGATVVSAVRETAYGRTARLRDPQGALFSVIADHQ